jgi:hypothetical protein
VKKGRRGSSIHGSHSCRWVQVPLSDSERLSSALTNLMANDYRLDAEAIHFVHGNLTLV